MKLSSTWRYGVTSGSSTDGSKLRQKFESKGDEVHNGGHLAGSARTNHRPTMGYIKQTKQI